MNSLKNNCQKEPHVAAQPMFKTRAFQIDLGRQPERLSTLKRILEYGALFHFNQCHLYLENKLRLDTFGAAAAGLNKEEVLELIEYAAEQGIEIVPSLNLLGHTEHFLEHTEFKHLDENRDGPRRPEQSWHNCLCPSLPETREWARAVIEEVASLFPSRNLHVGLDETWPLGSCPLCRERAKEIGLGGVFADYANFLNDEVKKRDKIMWMWADMPFYYGETLDKLSRDIVMADWHYYPVGNMPQFSFFNWRRIDSTRLLVNQGFRVVLGGVSSPENIMTFSRYAEGLDIDTFLATEWEGANRFQDNVLLQRCIAGNLLWTGQIPTWQEVGEQLLPDNSPEERKSFLLAAQSGADNINIALDVLRGQEKSLLHCVTRNALLHRHLQKEKVEIEIESAYTMKQMLRDNRSDSPALFRLQTRLDSAVTLGKEWLGLLDEISIHYNEEKNDRAIYQTAENLVSRLKELRKKLAVFCSNPSEQNYPFARFQLMLEFVIIDPCAHACKVEVSPDGDSYETIYCVPTIPISQANTSKVSISLKQPPRFVRLTIGGYARVGVSNVWCETIRQDFNAVRVVNSGGAVIDADHLLSWDQKSAIFNEADVETKWKTYGSTEENFVVLEFPRP